MRTPDADFIIVGSGPAGVSAAFPLIAAGRRVLMLDAGNDAGWEDESRSARVLGSNLESLRADDGSSPKLQTPVARGILERFRRESGITGDGFTPVASLVRGGLSNIWGAQISYLDAEDIAGWPIDIELLQRSYERVSQRIGISTNADLTAGANSASILPLGATAAHVLHRHEIAKPADGSFRLFPAVNAILSEARPGRAACDLRGDCLYGCPSGAIYNSRQDLLALQKSPHFRLLDNMRAISLTSNAGWTIGTADGSSFSAPRIILAAGVLGTAALLADLLPIGGEGLRLLNSPTLAIPLLSPARLLRSATATHSLAQLGLSLRYGERASEYVTGAIYEVGSLPAQSFVNRMPLGRKAGRAAFETIAGSLLVATIYYPGDQCRSYIHREAAGKGMTVRGGFADGFDTRAKDLKRRLRREWKRLGLVPLPGASLAEPGIDAHFAGTLPMGAAGPFGTSADGELNLHPGLHVVDGSVLPDLSSKYITMTIMANADRIAHRLAQTEANPAL
ncbi:choline dehydrogenase-related protein (plasmid) [Rhizobium phaseoli]|uniref:Choline dehydrogenase-related protein n=1 Tax=Rhizobium phaseoli TaxID=396 RepID=A0A192TIC6_9HYPH|nr:MULTISPECIES: FAD-dependent oxidoreductase [Rhizobium]ANL42772.1 choline dehydrogenase-related protein [Rhizobium phaseoli]ANL55452.1 choline dehydrogenase-related protein [Rhizobium phaseoli]ANL61758.1 choline dehydrogenase-related protein [Rhizobium phaseoli]ANL74366.1 choline dehydrogenase-related protein [Rhizobium phaseoli]ANL87175.1 choline dehydrogenase-related protein [Rhizobium phaseoli]